MSDERQLLFSKSENELREAFVRANVPNIEEWLAEQRGAEKPTDPTWRSLIEGEQMRMNEQFEIERISDFACPQEVPDRSFLAAQEQGAISILLESIDHERTDVYPASPERYLLVLKANGKARAFTLYIPNMSEQEKSGRQYALRLASHSDVLLTILNRGWEVGPKKIAEVAREFLCNALAEQIKRKRAKAEHDFNTAVAVSADGTRIVHADWVIVISVPHGSSGFSARDRVTKHLFSGTAFRDRKLLRDQCLHVQFPYRFCSLDNFRMAEHLDVIKIAEEVMAREADYVDRQRQILVDVKPRQNCHYVMQSETKIFLTAADFCPSPLPDDGVEVIG